MCSSLQDPLFRLLWMPKVFAEDGLCRANRWPITKDIGGRQQPSPMGSDLNYLPLLTFGSKSDDLPAIWSHAAAIERHPNSSTSGCTSVRRRKRFGADSLGDEEVRYNVFRPPEVASIGNMMGAVFEQKLVLRKSRNITTPRGSISMVIRTLHCHEA